MEEVGVPPALEAAVESLRDAVTAGRTDIVRRLLDACDSCDGGGKEERKQLINSHCAERGGTFLHLAAKLGHGDIVRALLSGGGDPGIVDNDGNTPLHIAKTPAVTAVFTEDLLRATAQSDLGRVCQLVAGGLSVNSYDNAVSRNTPLHWAASFADTDTLHCLIARGTQNSCRTVWYLFVWFRRHKGKTALEMAEEKGGEVLATVLQFTNAHTGDKKKAPVSSSLLIRPSDTLDMRALAGSLESLNSIGGDSLLLVNGGGAVVVDHDKRGFKDPPLPGRNFNDVGVFSARMSASRTVSVSESILENPTDEQAPVNDGHGDSNVSEAAREKQRLLRMARENRSKSASLSRSPVHSTSSLDFSPNMEQVYERLVNSSNYPSAPPTRLVTSPKLHLLWPQPRHLTQLGGQPWSVPQLLTVALVPVAPVSLHTMCDVLEVHRESLEECGVKVTVTGKGDAQSVASVVCCLCPTVSPGPLHYSITVTHSGVSMKCGSLDSLHSALTTFSQLLRIYCVDLPADEGTPLHTNDTAQLVRKISEPVLPLKRPQTFMRSQSDAGGASTGPHAVQSPTKPHHNSEGGVGAMASIESVVISDYPDIKHRAFMLDAAPLARIPNQAMMHNIVDSLASFKINQLHLMLRLLPVMSYTSTNVSLNSSANNQYFASSINASDANSKARINFFNGHGETTDSATDSSNSSNLPSNSYQCPLPFSSSEMLSLSRYCHDRGIALTPAFDLDPMYMMGQNTPQSVCEMAALVSASLQYFPDSNFVSIGPSLSSVFALSSEGLPPALDPWKNLGLPEQVTLIVCANVFQSKDIKHLRARVPHSAVHMEYGFLADHDFGCGRTSAALEGRAHAFCCGTAAWSSLAGFPEAGLTNVYKGCVAQDGDSSGLSTCCAVIAHWSTPASLTPLVFMWPALIVGAGLSWNSNTRWDYVNSSIGTLIDTHLVNVSNAGFGSALVELGRCETWLTREMRAQDCADMSSLPPASTGPGSTLHQLLADPDSVLLENLTSEKFANVLRHIKRSLRGVANNRVVRSSWPLMPVAAAELHLSADLMMTACRLGRALVTIGSNPRSNLGMAVVNPGISHLPPTIRTDVANRLLSLRESYSCLWLHCHQPAGLQASLLLLSSLLTRLLPQNNCVHNL
ncbi:Ankyrin repeat-containing domain [Trinorchestia longiramus]|nr:Ankyrin repeat-containing domain [Trinorchestia longiramus]